MRTIKLGAPSEKQKAFLRDTHRYVGYGGARGGGKSWSIQTKATLMAVSHKGIRQLIVRHTYGELQQNHIDRMTSMLVPTGAAKYNKTDKRLTFANGSILDFQYCRTDADLGFFQGVEYDIVYVDEATQFTEYQLKVISTCCRGANEFPHRIYYTCNPGGPGHGYIKRIFVDRKYEPGEEPENYSFTQALVQDNQALMRKDPGYISTLEALPPKLRAAWLEGQWDVFEGMFFEEFRDDPEHYEDRQWTHVIEPFNIPPGWKIYRSYDFGYAKPFSCGWWAIDYDGVAYRILEWYGCTNEPNTGIRWTPHEQFKHIHEIETQHPYLKGKRIQGVADPAIWNAESGESVADVAAKYQVYFEKGDNERIAGWMQAHYRMMFDENGYPMMYVFNTCKDFIRTIPLMMYDEHKVEDIDTELEDHIADEMRYFFMTRPISPRVAEVQLPAGEDPLNQRQRKRKSIYVSHG